MEKSSIRLHQNLSVVKVDPTRERIVESPDDLQYLNIKPSEVEWVRQHIVSNFIDTHKY